MDNDYLLRVSAEITVVCARVSVDLVMLAKQAEALHAAARGKDLVPLSALSKVPTYTEAKQAVVTLGAAGDKPMELWSRAELKARAVQLGVEASALVGKGVRDLRAIVTERAAAAPAPDVPPATSSLTAPRRLPRLKRRNH